MASSDPFPTLSPFLSPGQSPGLLPGRFFNYSQFCLNGAAKTLAQDGKLTRALFGTSAIPLRHTGGAWHDNTGVVTGLILVFLIMTFFYFLERRTQVVNERRMQSNVVTTDAVEYANALVKAFMPSWKLEKYQFRGMKPRQKGVSIAFEDLSLTLKGNGKPVLTGVTGEFVHSRMCAIMGPSGAGKTTFANVLCGKATYGDMGGVVSINGHKADIRDIKSVMGFVPQDDIVHENLTVREQISFSAKLRNKVGTKAARLSAITQDVLNVMQVVEIQNSIVGGVEKRGISGGQRKRVNIGLELAAQPTVLFLDEPTSGLDSSSSLAVVASLKKMTQLGMTSIMVIHQPRFSLFTLFDDVLLLGKGGQTVYLGPSTRAKEYFETKGFRMPDNENPADWFMDIISGELDKNQPQPPGFRSSMLFQMWTDSPERAGYLSPGGQLHSEPAGRKMTFSDSVMVLQSALEDEWDQIDRDGDSALQEDELARLIKRCCGKEPSHEVLQELMERMGGPGAEDVTKVQFVEYLVSLRGAIATDILAQSLDDEKVEDAMSDSSDESERSGSGGDEELGGGSALAAMLNRESKTDRSIRELNRQIPGFWSQLNILTWRKLCEWWRNGPNRCLFLAALACGAIVLGIMDAYVLKVPSWQAMSILNVHTALSLLIAIFSLGLFGSDRTIFWRESSTGLNVLAHFVSRVVVNMVDLFLFTFAFCALYFLLERPPVPFEQYLFPYLLISMVSSGWGYFVSSIVPPEHGSFIVSLIIFVCCGLLGNPGNLIQFLSGGLLEYGVNAISITRWSVQLSFMINLREDSPIPNGAAEVQIFCLSVGTFKRGPDGDAGMTDWLMPAVEALVAMGVVLHIGAFLGLKYMHLDKQV